MFAWQNLLWFNVLRGGTRWGTNGERAPTGYEVSVVYENLSAEVTPLPKGRQRGADRSLREGSDIAGLRSMAADQVVTALLGAFDAQSNERAASQEALQGWEGMPGYTPLLLQLYAAPPPRLTPDARLLAVVCLKNAVTRHWNARRAGVPAVPDADKAVLRAGLLQTLDEPEPRLSAQLLLLLAQARASPA